MNKTKKEVLPLEENKEIFTADNEAEAAAEAEAAVETAVETGTDTPELPTEKEAEDDTVTEEPAPKKSRKVQTTIIISAIIVLLVLVGAVAIRLFATQGVVDTGIFGNKKTTVWHFKPDVSQAEATVDEALVPDYYFIFEPDNTLKVEMGSFEYKGSYTIQNMEESDLLGVSNENAKVGTQMLTIENTSLLDGKFLFERTGNAFTENKLNLTGLSTQEMKLELDAKEYTPVSIERKGEFTKDDGTYAIITKANGGYQSQSGIYNCKDGTVTINFKAPSDQEANIKYTIKDKTLSLSIVADVMGQQVEQPIGDFTKEA